MGDHERAQLLQWVGEELGLKPKWPLKMNVDNTACISFQRSTNQSDLQPEVTEFDDSS